MNLNGVVSCLDPFRYHFNLLRMHLRLLRDCAHHLHNIEPKTKHTYDSELRKQRASISTTTHTTTHTHASTTNENQLWDLSLCAWLSTHLGSWSLSPLPRGSLLATAPAGTP